MDSSRFTVPQDLFEAWEIKEKKALISAPQEKLEAEKRTEYWILSTYQAENLLNP